MQMLTNRQETILALLKEHGPERIDDIAEQIGVTGVTVRRELKYLEEAGHVSRSKGVIEINSMDKARLAFSEKEKSNVEEKNAIARKAVELIPPSSTIILDSGTTTYALARMIEHNNIRDLAIVTNSLPAATLLSPNNTVVVTGGTVDGSTYALLGHAAESTFDTLVADITFIGASGMSAQYGLCVQSQIHYGVKRKMLQTGTKRVALMDPSKLLSRNGSIFCTVNEIDILITVRNPQTEQIVEEIRKCGVKVLYADM